MKAVTFLEQATFWLKLHALKLFYISWQLFPATIQMPVTTVPALILNASASNGFVTVFSTLPLQQPLAMHST